MRDTENIQMVTRLPGTFEMEYRRRRKQNHRKD